MIVSGGRVILSMVRRAFLLASILIGVVPAAAWAQRDVGQALSLSAGFASYDLTGTGDGGLVAGRFDMPVRSFLIFEPGIVFFRYTPRLSTGVSLIMPELSLQATVALGPVRPYLGVGAGAAIAITGPDQEDLTLHAVLGTRIRASDRWGLRTEARLRSVDPFNGTMFDITAGFSWRP